MMRFMTRSERTSLIAILTAIVLIIAGIVVTVLLGIRGPDEAEDPAALSSGETAAVSATMSTPAPAPADPLAEAEVNHIVTGTAPPATDSFGTAPRAFDRLRSWEGELEVWRGGNRQIILGPEGNWFPAGQPGCGDGRYLVAYAGVEKLTAQLRDPSGTTTAEETAPRGWMLLDDCHLPYLTLGTGAESPTDTVTYEVHEYQPAG